MKWNEIMNTLNERQLQLVCCKLLGRSGISDAEFIEICNHFLEEYK